MPQLKSQATAKTQPIPSYPPFFSHEVTDEDVAGIQKLADANAKNGAEAEGGQGRDLHAVRRGITAIVPGPQGGTNWQPTSYNPETGMFYVCAMRSVSGYSSKNEELPQGKRGQTADLGSVFTTTGFGSQEGYFLAIDASDRRDQVAEALAGVVLLRLGHDRRQPRLRRPERRRAAGLQRRDRRRPALELPDRRRRQHDGDGLRAGREQYLAFLAGGNALAATKHGDNLWLFSLDGHHGRGRAGRPGGEGTGHAGQTPNEPTNERRATPRRAPPSGATTAPAATARTAPVRTAARTSSGTRRRSTRRRCAPRSPTAAGACRRSRTRSPSSRSTTSPPTSARTIAKK